MAHEYTTWAYAQDVPNSNAKFVLVALADTANADGYAYPGQKRLARMTGMGERTVRRHAAWLEENGYLRRVTRRRNDGSRTSDGYYLPPKVDSEESKIGDLWSETAEPPTGHNGRLEPTGHNGRYPRPNRPVPPAIMAGHEPSVEPSVEPPEVEEETRENSNGFPLANLDHFEVIGVRMTRSDSDAEAAALAIAGSHKDLWRRLSRLRRKHKPEAVTWSEWVKAAGIALEEYGPDRLALAIDTTLATTNVRNPHALLQSILRDDRPASTARPRSGPAGGSTGGMESIRERYPEAFQ